MKIASSDELEALFDERYHSIRALERHLTANGTRIVKIFLHISKDEQGRRLLERLDAPDKTWKATRADSRSETTGRTTSAPTNTHWRRPVSPTLPGTSFRTTTNRTRGCSSLKSSSTRWKISL